MGRGLNIVDRPAGPTECRRCRAYCDWVVDPVGCVEAACPNLYSWDGPDGSRYGGCLQRVYGAEVQLAALEQARASGVPFGPLRCVSPPLAVCRASVQRAYERRLPEIGCVNPEFGERDGHEPFRVSERRAP